MSHRWSGFAAVFLMMGCRVIFCDMLRVALRSLATAYLLGLVLAHGLSAQSAFFGIGHSKDGDSLTVGDREVRLYGIDAPEWDQTCKRDGRNWACGQAAADELSKLVTGKDLSCVAVDTDQYHRTVAQCTAGELDVNRTMVALGFAVAYRRYSSAYVSAEESAKVNRRGLWAGTFELPSLYRREERAEPAERAPRPSRVRQASNHRQSVAPSGRCNIKGNRGSHGWIYHLPGMPYYDRTHAEEWFCTETQARAAGYRRSRAY
jgi:endonuclease YncB( thermonuclease family)